MNHPKATRLRLCMAIAVVAAFAAIAPAMATADVVSTPSTTWGSFVPGAHGDYTITQDFTYNGGGEADPTTEDLKKWIVDSPAGLVGNPNAVPAEDRCTAAEFAFANPLVQSSCPAISQVGAAAVTLRLDSNGAVAGTLPGKIFLLEGNPEVPTVLATQLTAQDATGAICGTPGCFYFPKTQSLLGPMTNLTAANNGATDFRIRTIPMHDNSRQAGVHISRIVQQLYAYPNNVTSMPPFLTNPHSCGDWNSYSYGTAYDSNTNGTLNLDPNNPSQLFSTSPVNTVQADCTGAKPALNTSASAVLNDHNRDAHPALSVSVKNADVVNGDNPSKVVVTLPGATTVDVQNIGNACTTTQRDAGSCPDAAQVGTASISSPLITAGLTGKVYIVKNESKPSLPDLAIFVDGAIKFRLDGTTKFVGTDSAQIETTFAGLPDTPFSDFTVNIAGGDKGLLQNRSCPTNGSAPLDGATTASISGFAGGATSNSTANNYAPCYGTPKVTKKNNCTKVNKKFSAKPSGYIDVPSIQKVQIQTSTKSKSNFHTRQTDKKTPYSFKFTLKKGKFKANKKYYYRVRVAYNDGKVIYSKSTTFKTCK